MFSPVPWLCLASVLAGADAGLRPGTQLSFKGGVALVRADHSLEDPAKTYDLTLLVDENGEQGAQVYWLIDERGQGGWPWIERFGKLAFDDKWQPVGKNVPALLYDYGEGKSVLPVPVPLVAASGPLAVGMTWQSDSLTCEVEAAKTYQGRNTWQVVARNNFGPKRTLWVDAVSPLVIGCDERVFMNKGTEYQLQLRFVGAEELPAADFQKAQAGFASLVALQARLNRPPHTQDIAWTPDQRKMLARDLPAIAKANTTGSLAKLARTAQQDLETQAGRANAVAELSGKFVGQKVEKFNIGSLGPETLTDDDLHGHVTVLHFWEYRDAPLEEPYGQVGYLEFLFNRRKADGVKVYGVAVDSRLSDEQTRRAATTGIRKLRSFMNLSYPVLLDGGSLIKQFGDPRLAGAELPLFVVIGPDGKILNYHVGFFEVDRQQGLRDLDAAVAAALKK